MRFGYRLCRFDTETGPQITYDERRLQWHSVTFCSRVNDRREMDGRTDNATDRQIAIHNGPLYNGEAKGRLEGVRTIRTP